MNQNLEQEIARMVATQGVYLVGDERSPNAFAVIASQGGKLLAMQVSHELDPNRFLGTAVIHGPIIPDTIAPSGPPHS